MKINLLVFTLFSCCSLIAQQPKDETIVREATGKYLTCNPFAIFEPQATVGLGFGNHFSEIGEYYAEFSYLTKSPFNDSRSNNLSGVKIVTQYRYHYLNHRKTAGNSISLRKQKHPKFQPFIGLEFRFKNFNFSGLNSFYNESLVDTIREYNYKANANVVGGAIIFGNTYMISKNTRWNLEVTGGFGGRMKFVKYKNVPKDYKVLPGRRAFGLGVPLIDEAVGLPYFPVALKIKYLIH